MVVQTCTLDEERGRATTLKLLFNRIALRWSHNKPLVISSMSLRLLTPLRSSRNPWPVDAASIMLSSTPSFGLLFFFFDAAATCHTRTHVASASTSTQSSTLQRSIPCAHSFSPQASPSFPHPCAVSRARRMPPAVPRESGQRVQRIPRASSAQQQMSEQQEQKHTLRTCVTLMGSSA